jgi:hypothetical protein
MSHARNVDFLEFAMSATPGTRRANPPATALLAAQSETVGAGAKMPVRKRKAGLDQGRDHGWVLLLHAFCNSGDVADDVALG